MKRGGMICLVLVILLITQVEAGNFFENIWNQITDPVEEELDRSRIGRELNRIVEDIGEVAEIMEEVGSLVQLAAANTPQGAIITLAIQYGHDPDTLWGRFHERVQSLETNNPGGGSGESGALSETELAAALQSVLEEPPLPEGVYLGDSCVVDLTSCPEENTQSRGDYYFYSCYLEGSVSKKKVNGLNKAACSVNWLGTVQGNTIQIKFPVNTSTAQYDWERCAHVIIQPAEQRQFLTNRDEVCNQPIAQYEVGDVCLVDYTSCGYGSGGEFNANRIGTIQYGLIGNSREYSCRITYGDYTLKESLRHSCAAVYVGNYEVHEFLVAHPEPVEQLVEIQIPNQTQESTFAIRLGDIPRAPQEEPPQAIYGRNGVIELTPRTLDQRKAILGEQLHELNISNEFSINDIKEKAIGYEIPAPINKLFRNERAEILISQNYGADVLVCLTISESIVKNLALCSEEESFEPTIKVQTSQSVIEQVEDGEDIADMLEEGRINYEAVGLGKKIKYNVSIFLFKLFR